MTTANTADLGFEKDLWKAADALRENHASCSPASSQENTCAF